MSKLIEDIKTEEGFSSKPYRCTAGKLTIGYGFNLDDVGLSKEEANLILNYRIRNIQGQVKSTLYDLKAPEEVWEILYHLAYQLGLNGLLKFKNMIKALYAMDYETAADEGLDSLWAKQTPNRANRLMKQLRNIKV